MTSERDNAPAPTPVAGPTFVTLATLAPTGVAYELWVDVGSTPPANATGVTWKALDPTTGQPFPASKATWSSTDSGGTGWDENNLSSNTLTVDVAIAGTIKIQVSWAGVPSLGQTPTAKDIYFAEWDQPVFKPVLAGRRLAEPNLNGATLTDSNTIEFSIQLSDNNGALEGAEVRWSALDGVTYVGFTHDDFSPIDLVPVNSGYYPTVTNAQGIATIRANTKQTLYLSVQAQMPGFGIEDKSTGAGYFVSLEDTSIAQDFNPITVDVDPVTGILDISGQTYIGASFPGNIDPKYETAGNNAWLYMQGGQSSYLVKSWNDVKTMGGGAYIPTANLDQSGKDDNYPVLFIQDPSTNVHASGFASFPTQGTVENKPPTAEQAIRNLSFRSCYPVPNPGLGNWLKKSDVNPSWHAEVPMNFPSEYAGWYIFFIFYLNGYDSPSTAYRLKADTRTIPDITQPGWQTTAQKVVAGLHTYSADLPWPAAQGYGPNDLFEEPYSYVDYYITPTSKYSPEQDAAWVWSKAAFYCKLNTR